MIPDGMLPGLDGLHVLAEPRRWRVQTPVVFLTARATGDDRVAGLEAGADDYLTKPFAFAELFARVRALPRRPPLQANQVLRVGNLELDPLRRSVRRDGVPIELSAREFALLAFPLVLILAAAGGWFLAQRALAPVDRMTSTAAGLSASDLTHRIGYAEPADEIGRLATTFDAILDRIATAQGHQRLYARGFFLPLNPHTPGG